MEYKNKFDIVIPTWNNADYTVRCLESIKKYTKDYRIIWVDNGSDKTEVEAVEKVIADMNNIRIYNVENLGFVKAVNQGLFMASADNIIIQNNDTEVTENWAEKLEKAPFDIVGPVTSNCGSWQAAPNLVLNWGLPAYPGDSKYSEYVKLLENHKEQYRAASEMVAFFSVLIRKRVVQSVGMLSEDYGVGFGDDDDYCFRAKSKGFSIGVALDTFVFHNHRTTFKKIYSEKQIEEMQKKNLDIFKNKKKNGLIGDNVSRPSSDTSLAVSVRVDTMDAETFKETIKKFSEEMKIGEKRKFIFKDIRGVMDKYSQTFNESLLLEFDGSTKISRKTIEDVIRSFPVFRKSMSIVEKGNFMYEVELTIL